MPRRCVINNCLTKGSVTNKSMYKFPKDIDLCQKWLESIKNPKLDKIFETEGVFPLNKRVFVCSDHFESKWLRDEKEPSQGLFLGAIPTINLNLSMDKLLANLKRNEMYKEFGLPKKMFSKYINLSPTPKCSVDNSLPTHPRVNNINEDYNSSTSGQSLALLSSPSKQFNSMDIKFPVVDGNYNPNADTPLDTLSAKDEQLLSLIRKKKMNEKIELPAKKVVKKKTDELTAQSNKIRRIKKERVVVRKPKAKKLKLRIKGTEKFMTVIVTRKNVAGNDIELSVEGTNKTIKIIVPKKNADCKQVLKSNSIKVVVPTSINGKEVQIDRSEISKIMNLVSGPKATGAKKRIKLIEKRRMSSLNNNIDEDNLETTELSNEDANETSTKSNKVKGFKNKQLLKKVSPLKSVYKKTSETNKTMRDFIESYFGEMVKCPCDFTPQENVLSISQRIIELKKKLVNAQKLLSKHKANNRKISNTIEELRKQIPEKPIRPPQKGQLIKCILPKSKINEKYQRGKHRFTKTLKTFSLDLFFSSPLSYSILEKIYLLPSRKTLKRWLVHPQNSSPEDLLTRPNEYTPEQSNEMLLRIDEQNVHRMDIHNGMFHEGMETINRNNTMEPIHHTLHSHHIHHQHHQQHSHQQQHDHQQHNQQQHSHQHQHSHHQHSHLQHSHQQHHLESLETNMGTIEDNIEPLQENMDEIMFRNDLAAAIMNT